MKTLKSKGEMPGSPSRSRMSRFSLRSRKKKERLIRGKLRIRSMPGVFLVLGVIVVVVGTALAVAGYWPYRTHRPALPEPTDGGGVVEPQASGWSLGAKSLLSTANLIHSERMKLLGPVIMGVGLFILICANTVLYENRDRETQMLLAQMRNVICSVSAAVPSVELSEIAAANTMARHYQWLSSLPAAHLNILCLQQLACSEPLLHTRNLADEDLPGRTYRQATLRTEALHHQESASTPSLHSSHSNSCNSSKTDCNTLAEMEVDTQNATSVKLSNCLVSASSMSTLGVEDWEAPATLPRRSHSVSYRTNPHGPHTAAACLRENLEAASCGQGQLGRAKPARRDSDTDVCVNIGGREAEPLELPPAEAQRYRSWPRLDLGYVRRYLKLDNKEDSVDKLLDQLEQQCSQWDKSFGSGPFQ